MKTSVIGSAFLAALVNAAPLAPTLSKRADIDVKIIQYALTLEHLEAAFYSQAVSKWSSADFIAAGFAAPFYRDLEQVSFDETTHVSVLSAALEAAGETPTAACDYDFGLTDIASFVATAGVLENVGVSAYLGAAPLITDKAYLTVAAGILTVEARHNAYFRSETYKVPAPSPFDTPLTFNQVYTLAAPFITSCPSSNPDLGLSAFETLTVKSDAPYMKDGDVSFTFDNSAGAYDSNSTLYVAWPTINGPIYVRSSYDGTTLTSQIPEVSGTGPSGQAYAIVVNTTAVDAASIVAGPATLNIMVLTS